MTFSPPPLPATAAATASGAASGTAVALPTRQVTDPAPPRTNRPPVVLHRSDEAPSDGRAARSHRTVGKIIQAMLDLLELEGVLRPTAEQVAARAGVSRRAVYLHFDTLDVLFATAVERRTSELFALWQPEPGERPLPDRIAWFSRAWTDLLEQLTPLYRASAHQEPLSARVTTAFEAARCWMQAATEAVFRPELDDCPPERRRALRTALHYATSCAAWTDLRAHGTDRQLSCEALHQLLEALLERRAAGHNEEWI